MKNPLYVRQLKRDIARWTDLGIIDANQGRSMLNHAGADASLHSFTNTIAVLGVVLLGASAISFVAANFWSYPKIIQVGLLLALLWTACAAGWRLMKTGHEMFAHAAYLLAAGLFGVNIMLIGQIYHISAHWPAGILVWALGALAIGITVPSAIVVGLAFVLGAIWTGSESFAFDDNFHWPFLLFWSVTTFVALRLKSNIGFHLSVLTLIFWLTANAYQVSRLLDWSDAELVSFFTVFWITFWPLGAIARHHGFSRALSLTNYTIVLFFIAFLLLIIIPEKHMTADAGTAMTWQVAVGVLAALTFALTYRAASLHAFSKMDAIVVAVALIATMLYPFIYPQAPVAVEWLYRAMFMVYCIWAVDRGMRTGNQLLVNMALLAFGFEILYIYFGKFSSFGHDAVFFFVGGVLLIGLSIGFERLRRRLLKATDEDTAS